MNVVLARLVSVCDGANIYASGPNCNLEETSPDSRYYGHFTFDGHRISVAHRHSEDVEDDYHGGPSFDLKSVENTSAVQLADDPSLGLATSFEKAAQKLGYDRAVSEWKEAQLPFTRIQKMQLPARAPLWRPFASTYSMTPARSCRPTWSVYPLFKAACKALDLDPTKQADPELKTICGGLATAAQGIGALRTKFGDAHGKGQSHVPLTPSHARLAVNAAGSAATFLMERWQAKKEAKGTSIK